MINMQMTRTRRETVMEIQMYAMNKKGKPNNHTIEQ
jgi:hypothetical protein